MFGKKDAPPQPPGQPAPQLQPSASYSMTASASGSCIQFTITNNGSAPIDILPEQFAIIPAGTRRVIPYDPSCVTLEVCQRIAPGQTVAGRAVFKEFADPAGSRLVFKPDCQGTYADIRPTR